MSTSEIVPSDIEAQKNEAQIHQPASAEIHHMGGGHHVDQDLVQIGNRLYRRSELQNAYAGDLQPGLHVQRDDQYANPVPLGLACIAICLLGVSLLNCQVHNLSTPNAMAGGSLFYGGVVQALAGFCCFWTGNTYGMVILGSYGGFFLSFGASIIPGFGVIAAYEDPKDWEYAFGYYLAGWVIFTFVMLVCTVKSTVGFFAFMFLLWWTFFMLCIGYFIHHDGCKKASGYFGLLTSVAAFYAVYCGVATKENTYFPVKGWVMPFAPRV